MSTGLIRACRECGARDEYPGRETRCTNCGAATEIVVPSVCEFCGGLGSIKVDFEHPQWLRCDACMGSGNASGPTMIEKLRVEWGDATTGETWELFLERELAYLMPRMNRAKELLGLCRMRGDLPKDLYDAIDDVLDKEYRE